MQQLIDNFCECSAFVRMLFGVANAEVIMSNIAFPGPSQWTCGGQQSEIVVDFKYLGTI
jgi:hypothetical protein